MLVRRVILSAILTLRDVIPDQTWDDNWSLMKKVLDTFNFRIAYCGTYAYLETFLPSSLEENMIGVPVWFLDSITSNPWWGETSES